MAIATNLHSSAIITNTNANEDKFVIAELNLEPRRNDENVRPWIYNRPLTPDDAHTTNNGCGKDLRKVRVADARGRADLTLDKASFQFVEQKTNLSAQDFYTLDSNAELKEKYYKETEMLIGRMTGAEKVLVFNHVIRCHEEEEKTTETGPRNYARYVHCDFAETGGNTAFQVFANKLNDNRYKKGRFVVINTWRSISDVPVEQDPLAVCDHRSIVESDYIVSDFFPMNNLPKFQSYRLCSDRYNEHQWYYQSRMTRDEVLIFKQYDSDPTQTGRSCFHTAITLPDAPVNAPQRESIEIRALAFFPDHEPNTCPDL